MNCCRVQMINYDIYTLPCSPCRNKQTRCLIHKRLGIRVLIICWYRLLILLCWNHPLLTIVSIIRYIYLIDFDLLINYYWRISPGKSSIRTPHHHLLGRKVWFSETWSFDEIVSKCNEILFDFVLCILFNFENSDCSQAHSLYYLFISNDLTMQAHTLLTIHT